MNLQRKCACKISIKLSLERGQFVLNFTYCINLTFPLVPQASSILTFKIFVSSEPDFR